MTSNRPFVFAGILLVVAWTAGCGGGGEEAATEGAASETAAGETESGTAPEETAGAAVTTTAPASGGAAVIQIQEPNAPGLVAELTEATRKDAVLTVKVRFRNTGADNAIHSFETGHGDYGLFYVTAENQKYFVLKDSEGAPLAPKYLSVNLEPGQTMTWWAKFPAPPAGVTTFDLVIPDTPPFEDIPITDR
jgi:hypothetical protein